MLRIAPCVSEPDKPREHTKKEPCSNSTSVHLHLSGRKQMEGALFWLQFLHCTPLLCTWKWTSVTQPGHPHHQGLQSPPFLVGTYLYNKTYTEQMEAKRCSQKGVFPAAFSSPHPLHAVCQGKRPSEGRLSKGHSAQWLLSPTPSCSPFPVFEGTSGGDGMLLLNYWREGKAEAGTLRGIWRQVSENFGLALILIILTYSTSLHLFTQIYVLC